MRPLPSEAGVKRNKRQARVYTTGTAEETPNGQRRLRLASATNAAVPAYVELGLPLHTYHLPHWRRSGSLPCSRARAPVHANPFQISRFPTFLEKVRERRGNRAIENLRVEFTTEMEREVCEGYSHRRKGEERWEEGETWSNLLARLYRYD